MIYVIYKERKQSPEFKRNMGGLVDCRGVVLVIYCCVETTTKENLIKKRI